MTDKPPLDDAERLAIKRYGLMNAARIASLAVLLLGIAIIRGVVGGIPSEIGIVLTVLGVGSFFFSPFFLAKRWKSPDQGTNNDPQ